MRAPPVLLRLCLAASFTLTLSCFGQPTSSDDGNAPPSPSSSGPQDAYQLLVAGRVDEAEKLLRAQLDSNPNDANALAQLGYIHIRRSDRTKGLELLDQAMKVDPSNATALYYRSIERLADGPTGVGIALRDLRAALDRLAPNDTGRQCLVRAALAEALRASGEPQRAAEELERSLHLDPAQRWARYRLIDLYASMEPPRWPAVERLLREAKSQQGDEREAYWSHLEATMWLHRQRPDKAVGAIREALRLARASEQPIVPVLRDFLSILAAAGKYDELLAEADKALADPALAATGDWIYQARGIAHAHLGQADEAKRDFDAALRIALAKPGADISPAAAIISAIADALGRPAAIKRAEELSEDGQKPAWLVIVAYLQFAQRDFAAAEVTIERSLKAKHRLSPEQRYVALGTAGSIYMLGEKYPKAETVYLEIVTLAPEDQISLNNLACLYADYLDPPEPKKAVEFARRAFAVMTRSHRSEPNVIDTYGWALVLDGQFDAAIEQLHASLKLLETPDAHIHLAAALLARPGHEVAAREELDRAKAMIEARRATGGRADAKLEAQLQALLKRATVTPRDP